MTLMLVCEGSCNPGRESIDAEVRSYRSTGFGAAEHGFVPALPAHLVEDLRSLRHMPHTVLQGEWSKCDVCQSIRRHQKVS